MYKMKSRNKGITAANAIRRTSCFIFRTGFVILVQYYGIFNVKNENKLNFLFCVLSLIRIFGHPVGIACIGHDT